jgi:thioredoxin reductase (NADPH)
VQHRLREVSNIRLILESTIEELVAKNGALSALRVKGADGKVEEYPTSALFVSIGSVPATSVFAGQLELDAHGYIKCAPDMCATSVAGVFAAGDVKNPRFRQAVIAAGSGAQAAMEANDYLSSL